MNHPLPLCKSTSVSFISRPIILQIVKRIRTDPFVIDTYNNAVKTSPMGINWRQQWILFFMYIGVVKEHLSIFIYLNYGTRDKFCWMRCTQMCKVKIVSSSLVLKSLVLAWRIRNEASCQSLFSFYEPMYARWKRFYGAYLQYQRGAQLWWRRDSPEKLFAKKYYSNKIKTKISANVRKSKNIFRCLFS